MASFNKFDSFVEELAEGAHNFSSDATCTLTVALTNTLPVAANAILADITQISYTGLSSRVVNVSASSQTSGLYKLVVDDLILTASSSVGPFQYVVIYNDDHSSDGLVCWFDYGSAVTIPASGEFTINFDGSNGLFSLQ